MADDIVVKFDTRAAERFLQRLAGQQMPFARAKALTMTAQDAQADVRASLYERFTIRRPWVPGGIRITAAKKHDAVPFAEVGSRDEFMLKQETGGVKGPAPGKRTVAIPAGVRGSKRAIVPRVKWPAKLLAKPRTFITNLGGDTSGLIRMGSRNAGFKLLWVFKKSITLKPRFGFHDTVTATVHRTWADNQRKALIEAVRTARPPR